MKTKIKFLAGCAVFSTCISMAFAQGCGVTAPTSQYLVLSPQQFSTTNFAFNINCPNAYNITFNSLNSSTSDGLGFLNNQQHKLKTKMSAHSQQNIPWGIPILQMDHRDNHYVVSITVVDSIQPITPAGMYKDRILINIEY